ncbi:putative Phosphatidylinositol-3-phosphatase SAC1 [Blattamonas nauphoetae]|uniref:Phosphatidylinositol-3-phosphatase SAC1 n=1 Tax=Blattamonas nauphoetae TaxID=2049346 RepID=A0ABQ9Y029_9EUKA|nr:putative Phosphatidylinositol-3-phosphatase SAC1 [Blattamonas nauphoetae]
MPGTNLVTLRCKDENDIYITYNKASYILGRLSGSVAPVNSVPEGTSHSIACLGLLGVYPLPSSYVCLLVQQVDHVGEILGHTILRVVRGGIYPPREVILQGITDSDEKRDTAEFLDKLLEMINDKTFYYSEQNGTQPSANTPVVLPNWTIGNTVQNASKASDSSLSAVQNFKPDFMWNRFLCEPFIQAKLTSLVTPIIRGFATVAEYPYQGKIMKYAVISRVRTNRSGYRFQRRGCDSDGYCTNFIESEQIVGIEKTLFSYVQIRGSVPMRWVQMPNIAYKPTVYFRDDWKTTLQTTKKHFTQLNEEYGNVYAVSLLDEKKTEKELGHTYAAVMKELRKDSSFAAANDFSWFDFHLVCKGMKFERVAKLLTLVPDVIKNFGYFMSVDGTIKHEQRGVFRTNCLDTLDRTGVVQHLLSMEALHSELVEAGVFVEEDKPAEAEFPFPTSGSKKVDSALKIVWSDNANAAAFVNTSTNAMKADYTRTGKRTKMGALQDGVIAVDRYIRNNFTHGNDQDKLDLFLGKYDPRTARKDGKYVSPFAKRPSKFPIATIQMLLIVCAVVGVLLALVVPKPSHLVGESLKKNGIVRLLDAVIALVVCLGAAAGLYYVATFKVMKASSDKYVTHSYLVGDDARKVDGQEKALLTSIMPKSDKAE